MTEWTWGEKGVEIKTFTGEVASFEVLPRVKESELLAYSNKVMTAAEILETLQDAKLAFNQGLASYEGAYENLQKLIPELNHAAEEMLKHARDIDVFFQPQGLSAHFGNDVRTLTRFVLEFVAKAYVKSRVGVN